MKAALVALLAAPAAQAFTPASLQGVWSCKTLDKFIFTQQQVVYSLPTGTDRSGTPTATAAEGTNSADPVNNADSTFDDSEQVQRILVFDNPNGADRRLSGRQFWLHNGATDAVEEHAFHGVMTSAIDAKIYMDPNSANTECQWAPVGQNTAPRQMFNDLNNGDTLSTNEFAGFVVDGMTEGDLAEAGTDCDISTAGVQDCATDRTNCGADSMCRGRGMCNDTPAGPYHFTMDDADHFTFEIWPQDYQRKHHPGAADTQSNAFASLATDRIFGVEKCMRGLESQDEMCGRMTRAGIRTNEEKDNACQGQLVCASSSTSTPWGCQDDAAGNPVFCCSLPYRQQQPYSPTPYYYPSNYYNYQAYSSPYYNFGR